MTAHETASPAPVCAHCVRHTQRAEPKILSCSTIFDYSKFFPPAQEGARKTNKQENKKETGKPGPEKLSRTGPAYGCPLCAAPGVPAAGAVRRYAHHTPAHTTAA